VIAVGDRGEVGRRRHDGGRNGGTKEGETRAQQRRRDSGTQEGAMEARRRAQRGRDGGATVAESASFLPAVQWRSKTGDASFVDGGAIGDEGQ